MASAQTSNSTDKRINVLYSQQNYFGILLVWNLIQLMFDFEWIWFCLQFGCELHISMNTLKFMFSTFSMEPHVFSSWPILRFMNKVTVLWITLKVENPYEVIKMRHSFRHFIQPHSFLSQFTSWIKKKKPFEILMNWLYSTASKVNRVCWLESGKMVDDQ